MLTEFQLTNFKAFGGPETIPIRPLTLIFGPNSSGKSSIFQSILMLKQTLDQSDSSQTRLLFKGNLVDLGSYKELIHRHDVHKSFSFRVTMPLVKDFENLWDMPVTLIDDLRKEFDNLKGCISEYQSIGMTINFLFDQQSFDIIVIKIELYLGDDNNPLIIYSNFGKYTKLESINNQHKFWLNDSVKNIIASFTSDSKSKEIDEEMIETLRGEESLTNERLLDIINISKEKKNKLCNEEKRPFCCRESDLLSLDKYLPVALNNHSIEEIISEYSGYDSDDAGNLSLLTLAVAELFRRFLTKVQYIGPQREYPERVFSFSGIQTQYVGKSGKFVPDLLITDQELKDRVNYWFGRLKVEYKLEVFPLANSAAQIYDLFTLRLMDTKSGLGDPDSGVLVGLSDVGYGISQVLPVIIQSLISREKTILIEQPELHLHPGLQAELGDMFIESALGERRNTFLIETHSEHLILRIMRRMRDTFNGTLPKDLPPIRPQDVAVLYVEKDGPQSIVREMPLNERGELVKAWPGGFFEEALEEVFA